MTLQVIIITLVFSRSWKVSRGAPSWPREALADIARATVANLEALAGGKMFVESSVLT
jgi:hypothetical protein